MTTEQAYTTASRALISATMVYEAKRAEFNGICWIDDKDEYREIYLARKAYELARDPEMKPIKAHRRAQRYMEKRLLRNLWRAWRQAIRSLSPESAMPAASHSAQQAERSAARGLTSIVTVPSAIIPDASQEARRATNRLSSTDEMPAATLSAQEAEPPAEFGLSPTSMVPAAIKEPEPDR